tara:strand:+ start:153 stop:590 length:438 start_codon:yes stop_codon:yes gene_type:complete
MINLKKIFKPLKLRALDDKDLLIFSQCLYESMLIPSEIIYKKKEKRFAIALERFTWEIANGKDHNLLQILSILIINGVYQVEEFNKNKNKQIKSVKSISNVDNNILILLNNQHTINLKVKDWNCTLEDIGKPRWPATAPSHLQEN